MKIIFINIIILISFCFSKETLGLVTKSKGKVEYQKYDSNKFTSSVKRGLGLYGDDQIRTGDNGFSMYRYLEDASSIKILKILKSLFKEELIVEILLRMLKLPMDY